MVNETFRLDEGWIILLWIYIFFGLFLKKTQMGLNQKKKRLKIHNNPPLLDFSMTQNKCQMHRRCIVEEYSFRVRFFPPLSLFDRGLRKKFSDILETFAD